MAVHLPLSVEAQAEAHILMLSHAQHLLARPSGSPIIGPSQDIVLGIYYLTVAHKGEPADATPGKELAFQRPARGPAGLRPQADRHAHA